MNPHSDPTRLPKQPFLVLGVLVPVVLLVGIVLVPWMRGSGLPTVALAAAAFASAVVWWLTLLWTMHHLVFQLAALVTPAMPSRSPRRNAGHVPAAILYTTCDDFDPESCRSCVEQSYRPLRVYVCDDSATDEAREKVAEFCARHGRTTLVRRDGGSGFKAGNLNHALRKKVTEEWILLADADQRLPREYMAQMMAAAGDAPAHVAYLQGAQIARTEAKPTPFQTALSPEVEIFYGRDLPLRNRFGFVPLLGHGALLRRSAWSAVGEFPELVSEDFAFALRVSASGMQGLFVENVEGSEAFPCDFGGFLLRLRKFAAGTAELARSELGAFLSGAASFTEKYDFMLQISWYLLMPLVVLNGFASALVVHHLWASGVQFLHPLLPFLYTWIFAALFGVALSGTRSWGEALRFYFWAVAVYGAALPLAGVALLRHLFTTPVFQRTPKNGVATALRIHDQFFMVTLGAVAVAVAVAYRSPFTPVLLAQGSAYLCFPLYGKLCAPSAWGRLARVAVYMPGLLMLASLYTMWRWGRF